MSGGSGGQVRQRKSGLWEGRYVGADHRRHSIYGKTKREAQEKLRAGLTVADHGIRPARGRLTVGGWLQEWLTSSVEARNRPRTVGSYRETVERYINPAIGRIALTRLEPEDVAAMLAPLVRPRALAHDRPLFPRGTADLTRASCQVGPRRPQRGQPCRAASPSYGRATTPDRGPGTDIPCCRGR
jgi:hypothetical protein